MLLNNRYNVIQTLGSGGFGDTFLAEDTQMPSQRRCVIKQLKPINNNPQVYQLVQERFQREAAILEELGENNNQIPRLYAYFLENGQFFLVQEYIQGETLGEIIHLHGAMSENSVRNILVSILPVLDYVHRKGIVHRDIKPDNIIIRSGDNKPVLIDFGAVKETIGTVVTPSGNSTRSIVIGTPGFMPSEQSVGRPMFASDIYSLGMTAIFLLTGKSPQDIPNDPATGAILWRQYAPNVTPSFAMLLDKAIQFIPQQRFNSASEMLVALQNGSSASVPTIPYTQPPTYNPHPQPTQQNTIPVTPGNYQQQPNYANTKPLNAPSSPQIKGSNNSRGMIFGLLIGAGLISGVVAIASTLNRPSTPVTEQAPISENTLSASPTGTPSPTEEDSTPPPVPTSRPKARRTRAPIIPQETVPPIEEPQTPIDSQPSPDSTEIPAPVEPVEPTEPTEPTVSETPKIIVPTNPVATQPPVTQPSSPIPPPQADKPSPERFVQNYYSTINSGNLRGAWNKLSPTFQTNRKLHPQGYSSYTDWWGGKVQQIEINQVNLIEQNASTATVDAQLNYLLKNGNRSPAAVRFSLVWDATTNQWLVSDAVRVRG